MNENTRHQPIDPEKRRQMVARLATLVSMTKAIVKSIHDLGPTPTETVYEALVHSGLVDHDSFDRFIQLACATGEVVREGNFVRPATKAEIAKHNRETLAELVALTKEIQSYGQKDRTQQN